MKYQVTIILDSKTRTLEEIRAGIERMFKNEDRNKPPDGFEHLEIPRTESISVAELINNIMFTEGIVFRNAVGEQAAPGGEE